MIKVLLVDIDEDNIKNFRNYIKSNFTQVNTIRSLANPKKDIYDIIKNELPNLIIGDIRFFGLNTYQIIRNIYDIFPEIKIILYGNYNDSDYLKRSLDFGVLSYIFKPVKPAEFKKVMENAISILESYNLKLKEEVKIKDDYLTKIKIFEEKFLNNVLKGYVKNDKELERSFKYFDMNFQNKYCVCVFRIDHFKKIILTLDEMEKHLLAFKVLNVIDKNIDNKKSKATISNLNMISVIFTAENNLEDITDICQSLRRQIYDLLQIRVTVGVGRIYERPSELSYSYNEAEAALRYRFYLGYNSVIPISFVEPDNHITYKYPFDKEQKLVYATVIGEYEYCKILLDEIFDALKNSGELPVNLIAKIILDVLISISRYASEQNIIDNHKFSNFFSFKDALEIKSLEEGYKFLDSALEKFCLYVVNVHKENDNNLFKKAILFTEEKYYDNLTLTQIATAIGTTKDYLNNLFIVKKDKTFSEYLLQVRINKAKEFLKETDYEDELIAIKSGFLDAKNFRAIFKQQENMFPYDYRTRYGKH